MADEKTQAPPVAPAPEKSLEDRFNDLLKHLADHGIHFKG